MSRRGRTRLKHIELTPGLLSIAFGITLILLAGAAGFYLPRPEQVRASARPIVPTPMPIAVPTNAPSPTATTEATPTQSTEVMSSPTSIASPTSSPSPTPAATPSPTATPAVQIHVVKAGETMLQIAQDYGVTMDAILRANGLTDPDTLAEGEKLIIPGR